MQSKMASIKGLFGDTRQFSEVDQCDLAFLFLRWWFLLKKELAEYIRGERNAVKDEFILSREKRSNELELIHVTIPEEEKPLYTVRRTMGGLPETNANGEKIKRRSGGKRPYVIVMQPTDNPLKSLSIESLGFIMKLIYFKNVESGTGRLVCGRPKRTMTIKDMTQRLGIGGRTKVKGILAELSGVEVLKYEKKDKAY